MMRQVVGVQFKRASRIYLFDCGDINEIKQGSHVVLETEFGLGLGKVVDGPREIDEKNAPAVLKRVVRMANDSDFRRNHKNKEREKNAYELCAKLINQKNLDMKLVNVEYFFDASKAIFYFSAENRVDFRELVRDLARTLHTRIEMRQIGVRDETKLLGGIGCCGQEVCCTTFLREFNPVSVKMAKEQNLAMNPTKISGLCGRLMCCLSYEHKHYEEICKKMPKKGRTIETCEGPAKVIDVNILKQLVTVYTEGGATITATLTELQQPKPPPPKPRPKPVQKKAMNIPPPEVKPHGQEKKDEGQAKKPPRRRSRRRRRKPRENSGTNEKK